MQWPLPSLTCAERGRPAPPTPQRTVRPARVQSIIKQMGRRPRHLHRRARQAAQHVPRCAMSKVGAEQHHGDAEPRQLVGQAESSPQGSVRLDHQVSGGNSSLVAPRRSDRQNLNHRQPSSPHQTSRWALRQLTQQANPLNRWGGNGEYGKGEANRTCLYNMKL